MSASEIPIGTIVPFAGEIDETWLEQQGWLPCDGRSLNKQDYIDLALAICNDYGGGGGSQGTVNLPDLRGRFARAVSHETGNDPDAGSRTASNTGGNTGNIVGSLQLSATGKPKSEFTTSTDGDHTHDAPHAPTGNNAYAVAGSHYGLWTTKSKTTSTDGDHDHTITSGWDQETRPRNRYVNYIIKFQNA